MDAIWIVLIVIGVLTLILIIAWWVIFHLNLEKNIDKEIKNFLIEKNDPNYEFKNKSIENELRHRLKAEMVDLRSGNRYKPSYKNKTLKKERELYKLINRYYILDKKQDV